MQCRFEPGSSSVRDEHEDVEEQPVIWHRSRQVLPGSVDTEKEIGKSEVSPPSSSQQPIDHPQHCEVDFHLDEVSSPFLSCNPAVKILTIIP